MVHVPTWIYRAGNGDRQVLPTVIYWINPINNGQLITFPLNPAPDCTITQANKLADTSTYYSRRPPNHSGRRGTNPDFGRCPRKPSACHGVAGTVDSSWLPSLRVTDRNHQYATDCRCQSVSVLHPKDLPKTDSWAPSSKSLPGTAGSHHHRSVSRASDCLSDTLLFRWGSFPFFLELVMLLCNGVLHIIPLPAVIFSVVFSCPLEVTEL